MRYLTILRHAKSSWAQPDISDFDRPLNARGQRDAPMMAERLLERKCIPDSIVCSPAVRTRQTAELVRSGLGVSAQQVDFDERIYEASTGTLLALVEQWPEAHSHTMLIGHNPGLEGLGAALNHPHRHTLPTCAVLHLAIDADSWGQLQTAAISELFYDYPKSAAG